MLVTSKQTCTVVSKGFFSSAKGFTNPYSGRLPTILAGHLLLYQTYFWIFLVCVCV